MAPKTPTPVLAPSGSTDTVASPVAALEALTRVVAADPFGSGNRLHQCRIAGARLKKAMDEHQAAIAHAASLESALDKLVQEAIVAINGTAIPSKAKGETK
jgi:hypothetical protein